MRVKKRRAFFTAATVFSGSEKSRYLLIVYKGA